MNNRFFKDKANGKMHETLLDEDARSEMKKFVVLFEKNGRKMANKYKSISPTQLRRFFNEFRSLEKKVTLDDAGAFERTLPLIKMVKSKVAYSGNSPPGFKQFLETNINAIQDEQDFKAFMLHFEAVVGFCGEYLKS